MGRGAFPPTLPHRTLSAARGTPPAPGAPPPRDLPDTLTAAPASMTPLLGLTQYLRGAVVFTLKHTLRSVGLPSFRLVVTTSEKGPAEGNRG